MTKESLQSVVLVVDDDPGCRRAVRRALEFSGLQTVAAASLEEARIALEDRNPACVVTEFRLPDGQGVEFLTQARASLEHLGRVMLTGVVDFLAVQEAVNQGSVHAFFTKPWDNSALVQGVKSVIEQCRLSSENADMMRQLSDHNLALEAVVLERTGQLEQAKRELEAIFDSWDDPVSIVSDQFEVLRANRAYSRQSGLTVRQVPGNICHQILFDRRSPCEDCPVRGISNNNDEFQGRIQQQDGQWLVTARSLELGGPGPGVLCRYERER